MESSLLYFLLVAAISFLAALFLYAYKKRKKQSIPYLLILLRFVSLLALLAVLINPKWSKNKLTEIKPQLLVAIDNSASMNYTKSSEVAKKWLQDFKNNQNLQDKFDIAYYTFGEKVAFLDSLSYQEQQTNPGMLFEQLDALYKNDSIPLVLLTDGNQTLGRSYEYTKINKKVFPVITGDSTSFSDIKITQLNSNQFAFLDNKFPVEVFVLYKGEATQSSQLSIYKNKQRVFTKKLQFSSESTSQRISLLLDADRVGQHFYTAEISPLTNEKNTRNNKKDFTIQVVDQQTEVLLISSMYHPDLGAIKKSIETNKQRKVNIQIEKGNKIDLSKYQLVILYQPTVNFTNIFKNIKEKHKNTFTITGTHTDWNFLNQAQNSFSKEVTQQQENYLGIYNPNFSGFVTKNINFESLSPLRDKFGKVKFNVAYSTLLFQKIGNTQTAAPLLATYIVGDTKNAILFGEDLWRWRMYSKIENKSFSDFDDFFAAVIQYTASTKEVKQLHLEYNKLYYNNMEPLLKATYIDQNYQIDSKASLWLHLKNTKEKKTTKIPFSLQENYYQVKLPNLYPGDYNFTVKVEGKDDKNSGSFKVLNYNVEQQFTTVATSKLKKLAQNSGGEIVTLTTTAAFVDSLLHNNTYRTTQKSEKVITPLIDWRWLLGIIILSLSVEWFIRKYKGLI